MKKLLRQVYLITLFFYLLCVFIFSSYHGYLFFLDSHTYLNFQQGFYFPLLSPFYSWINILLALISLAFVFFILMKPSFLATVIFANPYTLLLLTNFTKEQALFIGLIILWLGARSFSLTKISLCSIAGFLLLLIRPIYLPIYILALLLRKDRYTKLTVAIIIITVISGLIYSIQDENHLLGGIYSSRSGIEHVGRDFFLDLCQDARLNPFEFLYCSIPSIIGFPTHEDFWTLDGLIAVMFAFPIYIMMFTPRFPAIYKIYALLIYLCSNLVIFWWGPTYGAFLRYSLPVTWIIYFIFYSPIHRLPSKPIFIGCAR